MRSTLVKNIFILITVALLTACGFHLRGMGESAALPFKTLYLKNIGASSINHDLRRSLSSSGIELVDQLEKAEVLLELLSESTNKNILSLSNSGKVREYEILYQVIFRTRLTSDELWNSPQTVSYRRDFSFSDDALLAKQSEEARLINDMRSEAVREIQRRIASLRKSSTATTP